MKNTIKYLLPTLVFLYIAVCIFLYFMQEKFLFHPTKTPKDFKYNFPSYFEEVFLETQDNIKLHGVHFFNKEKPNKQVALYLHGNGGTIEGWGFSADLFLKNSIDVFYLDYRAYGKSEGKISNEKALITDAQLAYNYLKEIYGEGNILLVGTSMGTGIATALATQNSPFALVLNAPYYSLVSLALEKMPFVPSFLVKYKFKTNENLKNVQCNTHIFHGNADALIPIQHSINLDKENENVELIKINNCPHNIQNNADYKIEFDKYLKSLKVNDSILETDESIIFVNPETYPAFKDGGQKGLINFLAKNLNYPEHIDNEKPSNKIFIEFKIDTLGKVKEPQLIRGFIDEAFHKEVIRVVSLMQFLPGKHYDKKVETKMVLPVLFDKKKYENLLE